MQLANVHEYARLLVDLHGDKAEVVAAQRERELEQDGEEEKLELWRRIRKVIHELRGPHVS